MLKRTIPILVAILMVATPVLAKNYQTSTSSHEILASKTIATGGGYLASILVLADGSNTATIKVYDSLEAAGAGPSTKLVEFVLDGEYQGGRNFAFPVRFNNGLYVSVSGTGASCIIEYIKN